MNNTTTNWISVNMRTRRQELQRLQENSMQYEDLKEKICTTCTRSIRGKIELKYSSSSTTDKIALSISIIVILFIINIFAFLLASLTSYN